MRKQLRSIRRGTSLAFVLATLSAAGAIQAAPGKNAYVTDSTSNTVSVIDPKTNQVVATIPVGNAPFHPTCTPNGKQVYVSNTRDTTVSVIDTKSNSVTSTIDLAGLPGHPSGLAFTPDGKRLFVTLVDLSNIQIGNVVVVTLATGEVSPLISLPSGISEKIVMAPDGKRAYTQRIDVIDVDREEVIGTVPLAAASVLLVTPDSKQLYGSDLRNNRVVAVDAQSLTVTDALPFPGAGPNGLAFSKGYSSIFVTNFFAKTLAVIDRATFEVTASVPISSQTGLGFIEVTKDGKQAYIVHPAFPDPFSDQVSVIDTRTLEEVDRITVGVGPSMVAICKSPS